jgi:hypothetical protein
MDKSIQNAPSTPQRRLDFRRIKPDNCDSVDNRDRSGHESESLQFFDCAWIFGDVALFVVYLPLRKILFRSLAKHSTWLCENHYCFCHDILRSHRLADSGGAQILLVRSPARTARGKFAVDDYGGDTANAK